MANLELALFANPFVGQFFVFQPLENLGVGRLGSECIGQVDLELLIQLH